METKQMKRPDVLMEYVFPSKDQLLLVLVSEWHEDHGFLHYYQVVYGVSDGERFLPIGREYFPLSQKLRAEEAYAIRLGSDAPSKECGMGVTLAEIATENLKYRSRDMASVKEISPFPPGANPFSHDRIRAGMHISENLTIMYRHPLKSGITNLTSLVLYNRITGRRLLVDLDGFDQSQADRIEEVAAQPQTPSQLTTLADLRDYLNQMTLEELNHPVVVGDPTGRKFTKISKILKSDMRNPLIIDQDVLVMDQ